MVVHICKKKSVLREVRVQETTAKSGSQSSQNDYEDIDKFSKPSTEVLQQGSLNKPQENPGQDNDIYENLVFH
jgi:hypothetical protein